MPVYVSDTETVIEIYEKLKSPEEPDPDPEPKRHICFNEHFDSRTCVDSITHVDPKASEAEIIADEFSQTSFKFALQNNIDDITGKTNNLSTQMTTEKELTRKGSSFPIYKCNFERVIIGNKMFTNNIMEIVIKMLKKYFLVLWLLP
eukprot:UN06387